MTRPSRGLRLGPVFRSPVFRSRAFATLPRGLAGYVLVVDLAVFAWVMYALLTARFTTHAVGVLVLMAVLALAFEEGASRAARLHYRLNLDLKRDMISVWAVAAAVSLPRASGIVLLLIVLVYVWARQKRPSGQPLHRTWFNGSTEILGMLCAGAVARLTDHVWHPLPWALAGLASVVLAMASYAVVNRALVTVAVAWSGGRGRGLLGTRDDNLIELATLCLGGLVSLAILYSPWLIVLALVPMVSLQRGALVRELETVATTDIKTGLLNAVALEHVGQREIARAEREHTALSILIVDIDRFKLVNDRHGHLVGDSVLRGVGKALTGGIREYDTVGRFGGEEFVAILPSASESEAMVVAERLRSAVHALRVSAIDQRVEPIDGDGLSISIGVSCFGVDGTSLPDLLFAADNALYQAKESGRNRVALAHRGPGDPRHEVLPG